MGCEPTWGMGRGRLFLNPVSCCFVIWMSACGSERDWSRGTEKTDPLPFCPFGQPYTSGKFPKGHLNPAWNQGIAGCSRGLGMRIPGVFQCCVYTLLYVVILLDGMRNTRVFDGFGTAVLAECLVSVYSPALVGLGEAPLLPRCPLYPRWHQQGVVEGTELLSSTFWARIFICWTFFRHRKLFLLHT